MPSWEWVVTPALVIALPLVVAGVILWVRLTRVDRRLQDATEANNALAGLVENQSRTISELVAEIEARDRAAQIIAEADRRMGIPPPPASHRGRRPRWLHSVKDTGQVLAAVVAAGLAAVWMWVRHHPGVGLGVATAAGAAVFGWWLMPPPNSDGQEALPGRPQLPPDVPTMMAPTPEPPTPLGEDTTELDEDDDETPAATDPTPERRAAAPEADGLPPESPQPEPPGQPTPTAEPEPEPAPEREPGPPERTPRTVPPDPPQPPEEPPPDPDPPEPPREPDPPDPPDPDPPEPPDPPEEPAQDPRCALLVEADLDPVLRARLEVLCG